MKKEIIGKATLYTGSCLDVLPELSGIDAVVTDPPYHLTSIVKRFGKSAAEDDTKTSERVRSGADGYARSARGFMGKQWDGGDIAFQPETWRLVFDAMKPGAHLAAFGGTRTFHRMVCAIEDAGFEIRDTLMWVYGSGFPKSHDVSKGIDKAAGEVRKVVGIKDDPRYLSPRRNSPNHMDRQRGVDGGSGEDSAAAQITAPATPEAAAWQGWGTALKPAVEPICLARKPLGEKTVAQNVLKHGTGAINVDGCRIVLSDGDPLHNGVKHDGHALDSDGAWGFKAVDRAAGLGRWPANLCHDGSDEVVALFPNTGPSTKGVRDPNGSMGYHGGASGLPDVISGHEDSGSAARFFYTSKADREDRAGSKHPTVKPRSLMRWLVRLITPPGGTVLDCFAGSGSTLQAALAEGFHAIGIEREEEYAKDIKRRLQRVSGEDAPLFQTTQALQRDLAEVWGKE